MIATKGFGVRVISGIELTNGEGVKEGVRELKEFDTTGLGLMNVITMSGVGVNVINGVGTGVDTNTIVGCGVGVSGVRVCDIETSGLGEIGEGVGVILGEASGETVSEGVGVGVADGESVEVDVAVGIV